VPEPLDVFDPSCVVRADRSTSFEQIATDNGAGDAFALWLENGRTDSVAAGTLVDICPANALDDVNGEPRPQLDESAVQAALASNVERQQDKLNEMFAGYGIADLAVDGVSGKQTGQRLCAARLALGEDTTIGDMMPGSNEQAALFAAATLPTPNSTAIESEQWVLIDRTCQIMFIGTGADTTFVFPTSTGSEGFETRDQDRAEAFRFNPALDNGGWHDSSEFPTGVDNPLNGNLYKPLYFDLGQAIHGANNVPTTPQSKGCARLRVADQNTFVAWLGLDTATGETWRKPEMNITVNVQGEFVPRAETPAR
jgi:lipoprotein-anchoring transpeptidase ErfK/SrfK